MKDVLISIQPKWCAKIASGEKTVEIRKTKPKIDTPFRAYIYCTLPPREEIFWHGGICEYASELIRLQNGEIVYDYGMRLCCDTEGRPYTSDNFLCRMVIGEFVCDRITPLFNICTDDWELLKGDTHEWHKQLVGQACLTETELKAYAKGKKCFAWHIADLKIYDKPKLLADFYNECHGLDNTGLCYECENAVGEECDCALNGRLHLTRPPQSWCYVER